MLTATSGKVYSHLSQAQVLTVIAQLYQHNEKQRNRYQIVLETLLKAEKETNELIQDIQAALDLHEEEGKRLGTVVTESDGSENSLAKGKGKAREDSASNGEDEDDLPHNAAGEEHRIKRRAFQQRLRECQITLHKVCFLKGDVYHFLGNTAEENSAFEKAEELRRVLLRSVYSSFCGGPTRFLRATFTGTEEAAERAMKQLVGEMGERHLTEQELLIDVPYCGAGGIRSSALVSSVQLYPE